MENARTNPDCVQFLPPSAGDASDTSKAVNLCETRTKKQRCECGPESLAAICTYRICGFEGGHYYHADLVYLAGRIKSSLKDWDTQLKDSQYTARFVGYADGMAWMEGSLPKPRPIKLQLKACLRRATKHSNSSLPEISGQERRDVEVALLRGCAFEEAVRGVIEDFELDAPPSFSLRERQDGVRDAELRSAELKVIIAGGCEDLQ